MWHGILFDFLALLSLTFNNLTPCSHSAIDGLENLFVFWKNGWKYLSLTIFSLMKNVFIHHRTLFFLTCPRFFKEIWKKSVSKPLITKCKHIRPKRKSRWLWVFSAFCMINNEILTTNLQNITLGIKNIDERNSFKIQLIF